ncbi:MAG: hypothetical protein PHR11_01145 [Candidatus Omnitrophica bacterium]|nr:hypothetical protein [Candidatus Omnitrophota bacterium]
MVCSALSDHLEQLGVSELSAYLEAKETAVREVAEAVAAEQQATPQAVEEGLFTSREIYIKLEQMFTWSEYRHLASPFRGEDEGEDDLLMLAIRRFYASARFFYGPAYRPFTAALKENIGSLTAEAHNELSLEHPKLAWIQDHVTEYAALYPTARILVVAYQLVSVEKIRNVLLAAGMDAGVLEAGARLDVMQDELENSVVITTTSKKGEVGHLPSGYHPDVVIFYRPEPKEAAITERLQPGVKQCVVLITRGTKDEGLNRLVVKKGGFSLGDAAVIGGTLFVLFIIAGAVFVCLRHISTGELWAIGGIGAFLGLCAVVTPAQPPLWNDEDYQALEHHRKLYEFLRGLLKRYLARLKTALDNLLEELARFAPQAHLRITDELDLDDLVPLFSDNRMLNQQRLNRVAHALKSTEATARELSNPYVLLKPAGELSYALALVRKTLTALRYLQTKGPDVLARYMREKNSEAGNRSSQELAKAFSPQMRESLAWLRAHNVSHGKAGRLVTLLELMEQHEPGPFVVALELNDTAVILERALQKLGKTVNTFNVRSDARMAAVRAFAAGETKVLIVSFEAEAQVADELAAQEFILVREEPKGWKVSVHTPQSAAPSSGIQARQLPLFPLGEERQEGRRSSRRRRNTYPLVVSRAIRKKYNQAFGKGRIIGEVRCEDGVLSFSSDFGYQDSRVLRGILGQLRVLSDRAPPLSFRIIVTTNPYHTEGCVAAVDISSRTVWLHPYFFELSFDMQLCIMYHELISHLAKGIADEKEALFDTDEFMSTYFATQGMAPDKINNIIARAVSSVGQAKVLFVCTYNMNRSASMHLATEAFLAQNGLEANVLVRSGGTYKWEPRSMLGRFFKKVKEIVLFYLAHRPIVKTIAVYRGVAPEAVKAFKYRALEDSDIMWADIIVAATEDENRIILSRCLSQCPGEIALLANKTFLFYDMLPESDRLHGKDLPDRILFEHISDTLAAHLFPAVREAVAHYNLAAAHEAALFSPAEGISAYPRTRNPSLTMTIVVCLFFALVIGVIFIMVALSQADPAELFFGSLFVSFGGVALCLLGFGLIAAIMTIYAAWRFMRFSLRMARRPADFLDLYELDGPKALFLYTTRVFDEENLEKAKAILNNMPPTATVIEHPLNGKLLKIYMRTVLFVFQNIFSIMGQQEYNALRADISLFARLDQWLDNAQSNFEIGIPLMKRLSPGCFIGVLAHEIAHNFVPNGLRKTAIAEIIADLGAFAILEALRMFKAIKSFQKRFYYKTEAKECRFCADAKGETHTVARGQIQWIIEELRKKHYPIHWCILFVLAVNIARENHQISFADFVELLLRQYSYAVEVIQKKKCGRSYDPRGIVGLALRRYRSEVQRGEFWLTQRNPRAMVMPWEIAAALHYLKPAGQFFAALRYPRQAGYFIRIGHYAHIAAFSHLRKLHPGLIRAPFDLAAAFFYPLAWRAEDGIHWNVPIDTIRQALTDKGCSREDADYFIAQVELHESRLSEKEALQAQADFANAEPVSPDDASSLRRILHPLWRIACLISMFIPPTLIGGALFTAVDGEVGLTVGFLLALCTIIHEYSHLYMFRYYGFNKAAVVSPLETAVAWIKTKNFTLFKFLVLQMLSIVMITVMDKEAFLTQTEPQELQRPQENEYPFVAAVGPLSHWVLITLGFWAGQLLQIDPIIMVYWIVINAALFIGNMFIIVSAVDGAQMIIGIHKRLKKRFASYPAGIGERWEHFNTRFGLGILLYLLGSEWFIAGYGDFVLTLVEHIHQINLANTVVFALVSLLFLAKYRHEVFRFLKINGSKIVLGTLILSLIGLLYFNVLRQDAVGLSGGFSAPSGQAVAPVSGGMAADGLGFLMVVRKAIIDAVFFLYHNIRTVAIAVIVWQAGGEAVFKRTKALFKKMLPFNHAITSSEMYRAAEIYEHLERVFNLLGDMLHALEEYLIEQGRPRVLVAERRGWNIVWHLDYRTINQVLRERGYSIVAATLLITQIALHESYAEHDVGIAAQAMMLERLHFDEEDFYVKPTAAVTPAGTMATKQAQTTGGLAPVAAILAARLSALPLSPSERAAVGQSFNDILGADAERPAIPSIDYFVKYFQGLDQETVAALDPAALEFWQPVWHFIPKDWGRDRDGRAKPDTCVLWSDIARNYIAAFVRVRPEAEISGVRRVIRKRDSEVRQIIHSWVEFKKQDAWHIADGTLSQYDEHKDMVDGFVMAANAEITGPYFRLYFGRVPGCEATRFEYEYVDAERAEFSERERALEFLNSLPRVTKFRGELPRLVGFHHLVSQTAQKRFESFALTVGSDGKMAEASGLFPQNEEMIARIAAALERIRERYGYVLFALVNKIEVVPYIDEGSLARIEGNRMYLSGAAFASDILLFEAIHHEMKEAVISLLEENLGVREITAILGSMRLFLDANLVNDRRSVAQFADGEYQEGVLAFLSSQDHANEAFARLYRMLARRDAGLFEGGRLNEAALVREILYALFMEPQERSRYQPQRDALNKKISFDEAALKVKLLEQALNIILEISSRLSLEETRGLAAPLSERESEENLRGLRVRVSGTMEYLGYAAPAPMSHIEYINMIAGTMTDVYQGKLRSTAWAHSHLIAVQDDPDDPAIAWAPAADISRDYGIESAPALRERLASLAGKDQAPVVFIPLQRPDMISQTHDIHNRVNRVSVRFADMEMVVHLKGIGMKRFPPQHIYFRPKNGFEGLSSSEALDAVLLEGGMIDESGEIIELEQLEKSGITCYAYYPDEPEFPQKFWGGERGQVSRKVIKVINAIQARYTRALAAGDEFLRFLKEAYGVNALTCMLPVGVFQVQAVPVHVKRPRDFLREYGKLLSREERKAIKQGGAGCYMLENGLSIAGIPREAINDRVVFAYALPTGERISDLGVAPLHRTKFSLPEEERMHHERWQKVFAHFGFDLYFGPDSISVTRHGQALAVEEASEQVLQGVIANLILVIYVVHVLMDRSLGRLHESRQYFGPYESTNIDASGWIADVIDFRGKENQQLDIDAIEQAIIEYAASMGIGDPARFIELFRGLLFRARLFNQAKVPASGGARQP